MPGRPTIFTPAKKDIACALLEVGASQTRAAKGAGVDESVLRYAIDHDEEFAQRVREIYSNYEMDLRVEFRMHATKSWRACLCALQMLEKHADGKPDFDTQCKMSLLEKAEKEAQQDPGAPEPTAAEDSPAILRYGGWH